MQFFLVCLSQLAGLETHSQLTVVCEDRQFSDFESRVLDQALYCSGDRLVNSNTLSIRRAAIFVKDVGEGTAAQCKRDQRDAYVSVPDPMRWRLIYVARHLVLSTFSNFKIFMTASRSKKQTGTFGGPR